MNYIFSACIKIVSFAAIFFLFSLSSVVAQPGSGGPQPTNSEEPPAGVPIDGGASLLLAAGGAYGLKKINDYRKGKKQEPEV
ncbi:PID-CTERM protein-sorting domain-containing protein [Pontibacter cellulosilyticus]|uniref:Uncharacterized protein n=1 Tax=Pontibacter cellulosilyticus TaxID=1720253 RepID=A0A923N711_9BACT|nr:hypothetical protein [Pontibacter cellulosilyticus]MBC5992596.1 hypothetical protein [Pontibacter cellulosilyticus]